MTVSLKRAPSAVVPARVGRKVEGRVVVIGASNAGKIAAPLERGGVSIMRMTRPGWAVTRDHVEAVVQVVELERKEKDVLVIHWLENGTYYLVNEDTGSMSLPAKGGDGIYHVTGRVCLAKEMQLELLLGRLEQLLKLRPEELKVLVCPLPRFLGDCCKEHERAPEEKKAEGERQLKELWKMRRGIKSFLFKRKIC